MTDQDHHDGEWIGMAIGAAAAGLILVGAAAVALWFLWRWWAG